MTIADEHIPGLPPEHDLAMGVSSALQENGTLKQENATLKRIVGILMRQRNLTEAVYDTTEIHLAMPVALKTDQLGNVRLTLES